MQKELYVKFSSLLLWRFAAPLFGFIYFYLLANLLGPHDYGTFSLAMGFVTLAYFTIHSTFSDAITKYVAEEHSLNVMRIGLLLQILLGALTYMVFFAASFLIDAYYPIKVGGLMRVLSLVFFASPAIEVLKAVSLGFGHVRKVIFIEILLKVLTLAVFATALVRFEKLNAAAAAFIVPFLIAAIIAFALLRRFSWTNRPFALRRIIQYSFWSFIFNLTKTFSTNIIIVIAGTMLSEAKIGYYVFGTTIAGATVATLAGTAISVMLPNFSQLFYARNYARVEHQISRLVRMMLWLGLVIVVACWALTGIVLDVFFKEYVEAKYVVISLLSMLAIFFAFSVITSMFQASARTDVLAKSSLIATVLASTIAYPAVRFFSVYGMVVALFVYQATFILLLIRSLRKELNIKLLLAPHKDDFTFAKSLFLELLGRTDKVSPGK